MWFLRSPVEVGPTTEELLAEALDRDDLSPAEISDRLEVAEALCQMTDPVLAEIWLRLDNDQLLFQDFAIAELCPERAIYYAEQTGRAVTVAATEASIPTTSTTTPTSVPTSRRPAITDPATSDPATSETSTSIDTSTTSATDEESTTTMANRSSRSATSAESTTTDTSEPETGGGEPDITGTFAG